MRLEECQLFGPLTLAGRSGLPRMLAAASLLELAFKSRDTLEARCAWRSAP